MLQAVPYDQCRRCRRERPKQRSQTTRRTQHTLLHAGVGAALESRRAKISPNAYEESSARRGGPSVRRSSDLENYDGLEQGSVSPDSASDQIADADQPDEDWGESNFDVRADLPDISVLTADEKEAIVPRLATSEQLRWLEVKETEEGTTRAKWVAAAMWFIVASKNPGIALAGAFFPLYANQIRAALKNAKAAFAGYDCAGIWHTQLQDARVIDQPFSNNIATQGFPDSPVLCIRIGDEGINAFSSEMNFPLVQGCESIVAGDRVEVLVLAKNASFSDFKVLREVYFPDLDMFVADYPFLRRQEFAQLSAVIELAKLDDIPGNDW